MLGLVALALSVLLPVIGAERTLATAAESPDAPRTDPTPAAPTPSASPPASAEVPPPRRAEPEPTAADVLGLPDVLAASAVASEVPADLDPPLDVAAEALPQVYDDDCFTGFDDAAPAACVYGTTKDPARSVVLFGDSHAAHWFPPLHEIADDAGWRLEPLVKASCPSLDLPVLRDGAVYDSCHAWQDASLERIAELQPDVIVLSNVRDYEPADADGQPLDADRADFHAAALARTIGRLRTLVPGVDVAVVGTTPHAAQDAVECLTANPTDVTACAGARRDLLDTELLAAQRDVALAAGATFVDASAWMCHESTCPPVVGERLVYSVGSHLSPPFTRWLRPVFEEALLRPPALPGVGGPLQSVDSQPWR